MKQKGAPVNIAVTVWGQRVSPVFDAARTLLIAEIDHGALVGTSLLAFDPAHPGELVRLLRARQVVVLICGAVSAEPAALLESAGFELIPFVTGEVQRVLETFVLGRDFGRELCMPGCAATICCRGRIRRGREISGAQPASAGRRGGRKQLATADSVSSGAADAGADLPDRAGGPETDGTNRAGKR